MLETKNELYRYQMRFWVDKSELILCVFSIIRLTPQGYWIDVYDVPKWVSNKSIKRFAYPTTKQALLAYTKRTERRIKILNRILDGCRLGLKIAKEIEDVR